jgi:hypothetical protein
MQRLSHKNQGNSAAFPIRLQSQCQEQIIESRLFYQNHITIHLMHPWNLQLSDPLNLTLSADARLSHPDYTNDHIWELVIGESEPPAVTVQTTFGLRAGWLRLFPRFIHAGSTVCEPVSFSKPPRVTQFYPNYLALAFSPFSDIDVLCEYWVPESQVLAGRIRINNNSILTNSLRLEWCGLLSPLGNGQSMSAVPVVNGYALVGSTENLSPVCTLTGAPQPTNSPYPALMLDMELFPGNVRQFTWALAALSTPEASLERSRETLNAPWDADLARIQMLNQQHELEIQTGNPDWDAAFAFTQKTAFSLFFPGGEHLPHPSFVLNRGPDQGFSPRGGGKDYPYAWSGQTGLAAWYMSSLVLPGAPELAEGLLRNFLHTQAEDGYVDWKPGLGGQRGCHLAQPLLATLALKIDRYKSDSTWLAEIYPALLRFVKTWFSPEHDRDGDGFPEWDHPLQTGYEDSPLYDHWHTASQGVDIATIESPSLAAFLFRECTSLVRIARQTGHEEDVAWLEEKAEILRVRVESTWDDSKHTYHFQDYQTHACQPGRGLKTFQGSGKFLISHTFSTPRRILARIQSQDENTRAPLITLHGHTSDGEVIETLSPKNFLWVRGEARATTRQVFRSIDRVEVQGLEPKDRLRLWLVDTTFEDLSLILPLWAGIPNAERAAACMDHTLLGRYLGPAGISMHPRDGSLEDGLDLASIQMPWNQWIGEALLAYGRVQEAAGLVTCLMNTVVESLKKQHSFRQCYNVLTGQGTGDKNSLLGLAPLGLFLQTLGIERITPTEIILRNFNPFPWPITVKYRGTRITCQTEVTHVTFADGQSVTLDSPGPYRLYFH